MLIRDKLDVIESMLSYDNMTHPQNINYILLTNHISTTVFGPLKYIALLCLQDLLKKHIPKLFLFRWTSCWLRYNQKGFLRIRLCTVLNYVAQ